MLNVMAFACSRVADEEQRCRPADEPSETKARSANCLGELIQIKETVDRTLQPDRR
jgi:hypothetical protein